jgi:D-alanyl-D-alanine carboxypeptidase
VEPGDTLRGIAARLGITEADRSAWIQLVLQTNSLADPDHIEAGQTLTLPSPDASGPATPEPETAKQDTLDATSTHEAPFASQAPVMGGKSAAIIDADCGAPVYGLNEHERLPPASLAKIITAIVTLQHTNLNDHVTAEVNAKEMAKRDYSVMGLEPGMQVTVKDLLYGLLLPSGNDAAETLAQYVGGGSTSKFVNLMNQEAASLGLTDTHFANPDGLDDPNLYSSAYDMAKAGLALLANPTLAQIVDTASYLPESPDWTGEGLKNDNKLLTDYSGTYGVKIGYDDNALQTIVAAAERNGRRLIVSILGTKDRFADAATLFDWAFANLPPACHN